ncbi:MAG: type II toxin-antitoxin system VapC family toxin [Gammaproteobacteria bacterium]|jgi:predicted nucleic acid-binding protein|nr:type II toxin-antitoxin system VapC family toxin [Xanthomonadales bacterium]
MIVLDTCVLIEVLKGNLKVLEKLNSSDQQFVISSISEMELYYGALNKKELLTLEKFCSKFKVIHINSNISKISIKLIKQYAKSHQLDIPDSLIAATCLAGSFKLYTLNIKDFKYIEGLVLY